MKSSVKYDLTPLNTFVKSLSDKYVIKVGIMGNKNARQQGSDTNAEIGALQEFGSVERHIPPRSFLRMPLALKGAQVVKEASPYAVKLIAEGKILTFLKRIGVACENVIGAAFDSAGFGNWKPNAPLTVKIKGSDSPLIDTGQLNRSISSKVEKI